MEELMDPILEFTGISLEILLLILKGIKGTCWIVVKITSTTQEGSDSPELQLSGENTNTAMIIAMASTATDRNFDLCIYRGKQLTEADARAMGFPGIIRAPEVPSATWAVLTKRKRQKLILRAILKQSCMTQDSLCGIIGCCKTHFSNALNGKRNLSRNMAHQLTQTLPVSEEILRMIAESAGSR